MRMNGKFIFALCLIALCEGIHAQEYVSNPDTVYGFDPLLYNGRIYTFSYPWNTSGNQYLTGKEFNKGSITIRGKQYEDLDLNYDIYNQQLLLNYTSAEGASMILEISKSWLNGFSFGQRNFEYIPAGENRIFQVIRDDSVEIQYFWKKELKLNNDLGSKTYAFSRPLRSCFVKVNGVNNNYRNNREFSRAFPDAYQKQVSSFLRAQKINVRKASDGQLHELVQFCNSLLVK